MTSLSIDSELKWRSMETALLSDIPSKQLEAVQFFRKVLSNTLPVPITKIFHLLPLLVEMLDRIEFAQLQFEIAWALTNVAYGSTTETHQLNKLGATFKLIQIVRKTRDDNVRDQAIWALSNIAGDCHDCRQYLLELGFLEILISLLREWLVACQSRSKAESRRTTVWALSNLSRSRNADEFDRFAPVLPLLYRLQQHYGDDKELLGEICWAIVYLTEAEDSLTVINAVLENHFVDLIVRILDESTNAFHLQAAVRAAGNIATGTDEQTQHLLDGGILPTLERLLDHPKESLLREICWLISNITAGTEEQIEMCINDQCRELFCKLNRIVVSSQTHRVRKEAAWAVCNALTGANNSQIHRLVQAGNMHALADILVLDQDENLLSAVLSALERVLVVGREEAKNIFGFNMYAILMDDCGGLAKVSMLENHRSLLIQMKCVDILSEHFQPLKNEFPNLIAKNPLVIEFNR